MNLYTQSALRIGKSHQAQIERLNNSLPAILLAEKLAETFTAAGVKTVACYEHGFGARLVAMLPIDQLPTAINTLHAEAAKVGRNVVTERSTRLLLVPANHGETDTPVIELNIDTEEI